MRWPRLLALLILVLFWGLFERAIGVTPLIGVSLAAAIAAAFEMRLGLSVFYGSVMIAAGEWMAGLPMGAWALGATLGLMGCHLVLHSSRPAALERAVALVMIVVPGLVSSVVFGLAAGGTSGVPGLLQSLCFIGTGFLLSGPLVNQLIGRRSEAWGQPR